MSGDKRLLPKGAARFSINGHDPHPDASSLDISLLEPLLCYSAQIKELPIYRLLMELLEDRLELRTLLKEAIRRLGPKITDPNEYHRQLVSMAQKVGIDAGTIHAFVDPIMRELADEMTAIPKEKNKRS